MGTSTVVYVTIGLFGIVAVIFLLRKKLRGPLTPVTTGARKISSPQQATPKPGNPYRAVSIISGENPCAAVKALGKNRFLVEDEDAPRLPLAECDAEKCACTYGHHEDRRDSDGDRRTISGLRTQLHVGSGESERREKRGRRESDWE